MVSYQCPCEQCSKDPAPTYTHEYMQACEARMVMAMSPARRNRYYDEIERRRGLDGLIQLKYAMAKLPTPPRKGVR